MGPRRSLYIGKHRQHKRKLRAWERQELEREREKEFAATLTKMEEQERRNERRTLRKLEPHQTTQRQRLEEDRKAEEQIRLEELRETSSAKNNGMFGPATLETAFSSRHDFTADRICETPGVQGSITLSSKPVEESFLSFSYRMGRERLSLHESAPGSRWPQRLSAQRNCGFAGGLTRRLRRDAVNEEVERAIERAERGSRDRREIAVPKGLQEAMAREMKGVKDGKDLKELVLSEDEDRESYYRDTLNIGEEKLGLEDDWEDTDQSSHEGIEETENEEYYSAEEGETKSDEEEEWTEPDTAVLMLQDEKTYAGKGIAIHAAK